MSPGNVSLPGANASGPAAAKISGPGARPTANPDARVPKLDLLRCFYRSMFLQAGWNPQGMQNLGFCYAITPALHALYPSEQDRRRALERHLEFFNCHPYLAAGILGATIFQETKVARGELPPEAPSQLKRALGPPFAALGDGFYWLALRPAAAVAAALTVPALHLGAVAVFLLLYNSVHLSGRIALFTQGVRRGPGVIELVKRLQVASGTSLLKAATAVMTGALAGHAVLAGLRPARPIHAAVVAVTIVIATFLLPKARPLIVLYLALAAGLAVGGGFF